MVRYGGDGQSLRMVQHPGPVNPKNGSWGRHGCLRILIPDVFRARAVNKWFSTPPLLGSPTPSLYQFVKGL